MLHDAISLAFFCMIIHATGKYSSTILYQYQKVSRKTTKIHNSSITSQMENNELDNAYKSSRLYIKFLGANGHLENKL